MRTYPDESEQAKGATEIMDEGAENSKAAKVITGSSASEAASPAAKAAKVIIAGRTITRGRGDWLGLASYDSCIRYLPPAFADAL